MTSNNIPFRNTTKIIDNDINQMDEPLVEQSLSDDKTINPIVNIKGILKKPETDLEKLRQQVYLNEIAKNLTILTFIVCYVPIIAGNLYFAYTDTTSCISRQNPIIGLTLYDYLSVQAYTLAFTLIIIIANILCEPHSESIWKTFYNNYILFYRAFAVFWFALGIIVLLFLVHKRLCNNGIYYYVIILMGVTIITWVLLAILHYRETRMQK